jgi:hypothetical protein
MVGQFTATSPANQV